MSRARWGLKNPQKLSLDISEVVADKFRHHCAIKQYMMGKLVNDLIIDYLIGEGVIHSREALEVEEQMTK